jgi:YkoP domain
MRHDGRVSDADRSSVPAEAERRGWVAPALLYPILALAERIDRRLRRITPIRPGGLLGVERHRHRGPPVRLRDGSQINTGDRADIIHFDNRRLRTLADPAWQTRAMAVARADFAELARRVARMPADQRPAAFTGTTLLAPFMRRFGFEIQPRRRTAWHRIEDWYLRSLLVRWAPSGRGRLESGRSSLAVAEGWLSISTLERRFGPPAGPPNEPQ